MRFMPRAFDDATPASWRDASYWLGYTLLGGTLPIWGGYLILELLAHAPTFGQFIQHGELAIYTTAILAPALHTVVRDFRVPGFKGRQFLLLLSVLMMFVSLCVYAAVSSAFASNPSIPIDQRVLGWVTIPVFCLAVLLSFFVTVLDYSRLSSDPRAVVDNQRKTLDEQFSDLEGQER
jgi:hypothetical protein